MEQGDIERFYDAARAAEAQARVSPDESVWILATDSERVRDAVMAGPHQHKVFFVDGPVLRCLWFPISPSCVKFCSPIILGTCTHAHERTHARMQRHTRTHISTLAGAAPGLRLSAKQRVHVRPPQYSQNVPRLVAAARGRCLGC